MRDWDNTNNNQFSNDPYINFGNSGLLRSEEDTGSLYRSSDLPQYNAKKKNYSEMNRYIGYSGDIDNTANLYRHSVNEPYKTPYGIEREQVQQKNKPFTTLEDFYGDSFSEQDEPVQSQYPYDQPYRQTYREQYQEQHPINDPIDTEVKNVNESSVGSAEALRQSIKNVEQLQKTEQICKSTFNNSKEPVEKSNDQHPEKPKKKTNSKKGFPWTIVLVAVLILCLFGIGYFIYAHGGINSLSNLISLGKNKNEDLESFETFHKDQDYVYASTTSIELQEKIQNGETFAALIGLNGDLATGEIMPIINEAAQEAGFTSVFYYNLTGETAEINQLTDYLQTNISASFNGDHYIEVPSAIFVQNGTIIYLHNGTVSGHVANVRTLTTEERLELYQCYKSAFEFLLGRATEIYDINISANSSTEEAAPAEVISEQDTTQEETPAEDNPAPTEETVQEETWEEPSQGEYHEEQTW